MTICEKSAYLKGLMDGLQLSTETNEGKMISAIVDLLGDITKRLKDVEDTTIAISDELDEIEEDLDAIEDFIMDVEDDEEWDDDDYCFGDCDDCDGCDDFDCDEYEYEIECSNCHETIFIDESAFEEGKTFECPNCGTILEAYTELDDEE